MLHLHVLGIIWDTGKHFNILFKMYVYFFILPYEGILQSTLSWSLKLFLGLWHWTNMYGLYPISYELLYNCSRFGFFGASLMAQLVKNPPTIWETRVRFLGLEDPLEKGMATHSSILAWRISWTEEPGGLQSMRKELDTPERLTHTHSAQQRKLSIIKTKHN